MENKIKDGSCCENAEILMIVYSNNWVQFTRHVDSHSQAYDKVKMPLNEVYQFHRFEKYNNWRGAWKKTLNDVWFS